MAHRADLNLNKTDHRKAALWLTIGVMTVYMVLAWIIDQKRSPITYYVSQWMVTFAAGFVRRGLLGQAVFDISKWFHIRPLEIIKTCHYALALALAAAVGVQCYKNRRWLGVAGICIILSNAYLSKYIWMETGSIDVFFILLPIANLWLARTYPERYVRYAFLLMATAGLFIALSHEAFFFLSLPLCAIISWRALVTSWEAGPTGKTTSPLLSFGGIYLLPVAACAIEAFYHGSVDQVSVMEQCWSQLGVHVPERTALYYMGFTLPQELKFVRAVVTWPTFGVWVVDILLCFAPLIGLSGWVTARSDDASRKKYRERCWDYLWLPIIFSLPMYVVGSDWDRWPAIPITAGVLCLLMEANDEYKLADGPKLDLFWISVTMIGLLVRPCPANVLFGGIVDGPLVLSYKLLFQKPI